MSGTRECYYLGQATREEESGWEGMRKKGKKIKLNSIWY
jgi:hypothetical protein